MKKLIFLIIALMLTGCAAPTHTQKEKVTDPHKGKEETLISDAMKERIKIFREAELIRKKQEEEEEKVRQDQVAHLKAMKNSALKRGYLTVDELGYALSQLSKYQFKYTEGEKISWNVEGIEKEDNPIRVMPLLFVDAINKDWLPFKAIFYLSIEKEDYDESELIRRNWVECLKYLRRFFEFVIERTPQPFFDRQVVQKVQISLDKLEIVGLTDPILVKLRKEFIVALNEKKWNDVEKIQNIITARVKELTPPPPTPQPQIQVIERVVEKPQVAGQPSGSQTTVVIQQPDKIQVEQLPRYGVSDYGRVLSIIGGKPMSSKDAATLKLFDMLTGR